MKRAARQPCEHLRVDLNGILRPWDDARQARTIRGTCQQCYRDVRREQTGHEIETGHAQTHWQLFQTSRKPKPKMKILLC